MNVPKSSIVTGDLCVGVNDSTTSGRGERDRSRADHEQHAGHGPPLAPASATVLNERQQKVLNYLLDAGLEGFEGGVNIRKYTGLPSYVTHKSGR